MCYLHVPLQKILADETLVLEGRTNGASIGLDPYVA